MDREEALSMVLDTLWCAISQNQESFKPAEKKLQEWEVVPGFYSILLVSSASFLYSLNFVSLLI